MLASIVGSNICRGDLSAKSGTICLHSPHVAEGLYTGCTTGLFSIQKDLGAENPFCRHLFRPSGLRPEFASQSTNDLAEAWNIIKKPACY
jgi:hypothetical protein